jgi:hypothetical protein
MMQTGKPVCGMVEEWEGEKPGSPVFGIMECWKGGRMGRSGRMEIESLQEKQKTEEWEETL